MKDRPNHLGDKESIILYAIGSLDHPLRSKLKLQKILFLVTNVFDDLQDLLKFEPDRMGPYCERIDQVLQDLERMGLVSVEGSNYSLTDIGLEACGHLEPKAELYKVIDDVKDLLNDLDDDEVMTFIYTFYPRYTSEPAKWNELKDKRIERATTLLMKGKVSFSKAAQIADVNALEYADILRRSNVKWRAE